MPEAKQIAEPLRRLVEYRHRSMQWQIADEFTPEEAEVVYKEIRETGISNRTSVQFARKYQLDGVIFHSNLTCRTQSGNQNSRQKNLLDIYHVPSLIISGDIVDARLFDMEGTIKKCEAFEETMQHYRGVRKEAGLKW
jgi:benzoyl-CoA reductase/2-hydroxyglutaryl-CoA dehydratase subunit BcrC/BadD/HgdB